MKKQILVCALLLTLGIPAVRANGHSRPNPGTSGPVHNILSSQLPANLLAEIKRDYKDYWITDLYKEGGDKEPSYFITIENADQMIRLSCSDSENWVITDTIVKAM